GEPAQHQAAEKKVRGDRQREERTEHLRVHEHARHSPISCTLAGPNSWVTKSGPVSLPAWANPSAKPMIALAANAPSGQPRRSRRRRPPLSAPPSPGPGEEESACATIACASPPSAALTLSASRKRSILSAWASIVAPSGVPAKRSY